MTVKCEDLFLDDKVKLLFELEQPGTTQIVVAQKFGVSTYQVSRLVEQNESPIKDYEDWKKQQQKCVSWGK